MGRFAVVAGVTLGVVVTVLLLTGHIDLVECYQTMADRITHMTPFQQVFAIWALTLVATVSGVISTSPVNLLAGSLLGVWVGSLAFLFGCVSGACLAFFMGRTLLREFAETKLKASPKLTALAGSMGKKGLLLVTLARLSPVFPYAIVSYAFGAIPTLSAWTHFAATTIGSLPGVMLYCHIGSTLAASGGDDGDASGGSTLWISLGATVVTIVAISMVASRVLDEATARKPT